MSADDEPRVPSWALVVVAFMVIGVWGFLIVRADAHHPGPPWPVNLMALSVTGSLFSTAFMRNLARILRRVLDEMDKENETHER